MLRLAELLDEAATDAPVEVQQEDHLALRGSQLSTDPERMLSGVPEDAG